MAALRPEPGNRRVVRLGAPPRPGPDHLPRLLLSVRAQDLGSGSRAALGDPGAAPGQGRIAGEDVAQDPLRGARPETEGLRPLLLSAARLRRDHGALPRRRPRPRG